MKLKYFFYLIFIFTVSNTYAKAQFKVINSIEPATYFVNHEEEIRNLRDKLLLNKKVGIVGISGIGKTQLARKYSFIFQDSYELIWFFDSNIDLNEQFMNLAKEIKKNLCSSTNCNISEGLREAKTSVMEFLAPRNKWLLVFDNIRVNQNYKLQDIIEWEHNGDVILCSQDAKSLHEIIKLKQFNKENAIKLVNNLSNNIDSFQVKELVEEFKGYPLLVAQGAMFLDNNRHVTVKEYKNVISDSKNKIRSHVGIVYNQLSDSSKKLLSQVVLINNQKFSKELMNIITKNKETLSEDILSLSRFGLLINTENTNKTQVFEVHDAIKDAMLEILGEKKIQQYLSEVIDSINAVMPKGVTSRYYAIIQDQTILSNLEVLLNNAEKYNLNIYKILELRKNLMNYYTLILDYYNCQKMSDWLKEKESNKNINTFFMNDIDKSNYSWYLADIGILEHFSKNNFLESIKYFNRALNIIKDVEGFPELKFTIYSQLCQTYLFSGNIPDAILNLKIVDQIVEKEPKADLDMGLYWFLKAKLALVSGDYKLALEAVNKNIEAESHLPQDTFTAPTYILKSEILNYLTDFKQAYEISNRIYKQERANIKGDHEIHARALTQLSHAQLGLGNLKAALSSAEQAKNIYLKEELHLGKDLNTSSNVELASAVVAEAEAYTALEEYLKAAELFSTAEAIYYNTYRQNMKFIDEISYLYFSAAKAANNLKDRFWFEKFKKQHLQKFGLEHFRSKQIMSLKSAY